MPDLTSTLKPQLLAGRLPNLDLGFDAVHPAYGGLSILNLPSSLCRWLGVGELAHPRLNIPELDDLSPGARQVVVLLIDAVSFDRFLRWHDRDTPGLRPLVEDGLLAPLTSVVPSTTSAALTTLWTGRSPAEHAQVGYELLLKEFGVVANMLTHSPAVLDGQPGLLQRAGFDPEAALPVPTLGSHLQRAEVEVQALLPQAVRGSGLSRMHLAHAAVRGYATLADLFLGMREMAESPLDRRRLIWGYYGEVDALSHRFGPDSEQAEAEFASVVHLLQTAFLARLRPETRRRTLLVLISDHGQIATRRDPHFELRNHPGLSRLLHLLPTGETRLAYLYIRPGQVEAVAEYIQRTWPDSFRLLSSEFALQAGLFGPGTPASQTLERLGDRILAARGASYLWSAPKENTLLGRHGGLSPEEMLVPFLAARL
ncbi:MAG: alkaline phosphatase family protein [Chloroflexota bacterium]